MVYHGADHTSIPAARCSMPMFANTIAPNEPGKRNKLVVFKRFNRVPPDPLDLRELTTVGDQAPWASQQQPAN